MKWLTNCCLDNDKQNATRKKPGGVLRQSEVFFPLAHYTPSLPIMLSHQAFVLRPVLFSIKDGSFKSFENGTVTLSAKETKWTSFEVRTHCSTFLGTLISKYDFGPVKLPGLSRNGPLVLFRIIQIFDRITVFSDKVWRTSALFASPFWFLRNTALSITN